MKNLRAQFVMIGALLVMSSCSLVVAAADVDDFTSRTLEWPTYRRDNERSASYPRDLKLPLELAWTHRARHAPSPAWLGCAQVDLWRKRTTPEAPRLTFDRAHHVVSAQGRVVFGTSADDRVVCLSLQDGSHQWDFFAEGPVRLAPTIAGGRVVFGSDDGFIYCVSLVAGNLLWKQSAVAEHSVRLPGNGRIISKFAVRGGVLVRDQAVFYTAGIFPKQGVWHGALALTDGEPLDCKPLQLSTQGYLQVRDGRICALATSGKRYQHKPHDLLQVDREFETSKSPGTVLPNDFRNSFAECPNFRFVGGAGGIAAVDKKSGRIEWKYSTSTEVWGVAIADDTLLASLADGTTLAFRASAGESHETTDSRKPVATIHDRATSRRVTKLLSHFKHRRGYALVLGDATGNLTPELCRQSEMQVIGVGLSAGQIKRQRQSLCSAGLYGRAVIHDVALDALPYVDGIFNLVIDETAQGLDQEKLLTLLRPGGGVLVRGNEEIRRPRDKSAGSWTHLYATAGNTSCSEDQLDPEKLALRWFGRPGPHHMMDRHLRSMAPVAADGYIFMPGNDYLFGVDAFNGTVLWERPVKRLRRVGVLRDCGSLALDDRQLYVTSGEHCLLLDRNSGKELRRLSVPATEDAREWAYIAVVDDTLIGSSIAKGGILRDMTHQAIHEVYGDRRKKAVSREVFAHDRRDGRLMWRYQPKGAVLNPTLAVNHEYVLFVESRNESTLFGSPRVVEKELIDEAGADIVALDRDTGKVAWCHSLVSADLIQTMYLACTDNLIAVVFSHNTRSKDPKKDNLHYDAMVLEMDGKLRWHQSHKLGIPATRDHGEQDRHPAIVGDRLVVEPRVYGLKDGQVLKTFSGARNRCGTVSASASALFFRQNHPVCYSFASGKTQNVNEVSRPGCWINIIPSDGLVLVPEASSGCVCSYPLQCSMAFAPE